MKKKDLLSLIFLVGAVVIFFRPVFLQNKIPVPADALVNLNYSFRDYFAKDYPRGVPYKNPLISDPVLQQIPWRHLSISALSQFELPLWNPYQMAGYPLLGTIQSGAFYPLNGIFSLLPFISAWTIFIFLQQILAGVFMYWYLRNRSLSDQASTFGALSFSFSGFFISWLEWGTIVHTALWLPLALLAIDKLRKENTFKWSIVLGLSFIFSFLAGHLQTFIYSLALIIVYFIFRWTATVSEKRVFVSFVLTLGLACVITSPVWMSQLQHIGLSARNVDMDWHREGWFIPVGQLMQFFAPDFFGNPATGNYWGIFNYGEFIGYIGMAPLILGCFALIYRRNRETMLWGVLLFLSILFASNNPIAAFPYQLGIPFFTSTQPTRLVFIADVALVILAAIGFESLYKAKKKNALKALVIIISFVLLLYGLILLNIKDIGSANWAVASRNLIMPTVLAISSLGFMIVSLFTEVGKKKILFLGIIIITLFDLLFFASKYTPFVEQQYFYPNTKILKFLQDQPGEFRIMTRDRTILSPNITTMYRLQSVDGYDPLYLQRYGELISASDRRRPDIKSPFGFNRFVVPSDFNTPIINLLGVKYILSLSDIKNRSVHKIMQEGDVQLFENTQAFPRAFLVQSITKVTNKDQAIREMFKQGRDLRTSAVVEDAEGLKNAYYGQGSVVITRYSENLVALKTSTDKTGFLVLTDTFYPTWKVAVDGVSEKIYRTDYNFRGVVVPPGVHTVEFKNTLL